MAISSGVAQLQGLDTDATIKQLLLGNGVVAPNGIPGAWLDLGGSTLRVQTTTTIDGGRLRLGPRATFLNALLMESTATGEIFVNNSARLDVGLSGLLSRGTLTLTSTPVNDPGEFVYGGGAVEGKGNLGNLGTITVLSGGGNGSAARIATAGFNQDGLLRIDAGAHLVVDNGGWNSSGRTELQGVNAKTGEPARLDGSRLYLASGGELTGGGRVANAITVVGGALRPGAGQDLVLDGAAEVRGPATIEVDGAAGARLFFYGNTSFKDLTRQEITGGGFTRFGQELRLGDIPEVGSLLTVRGSVALQASSELFMRLGEGGFSDALSASDSLLLEGGRLTLTSLDGATLGIGETFLLFPETPLFYGTFGQIDYAELSLAPGARLDTSRLYLDGSLSVVAVPEPATWLSLGAGLLLIGGRALRRRQPGPAV